ncbi:MAG TPA: hypothetical protein DCM05_12415 [Elusimicrobia bacterium]|nr:hypothetical protein [Elusimicrobiota bacterium]
MPEARPQTAIVETFLAALVKAAKTVSLYKSGHAMIGQIAGRVHQLMLAALGQEPNLPLELKAKEVLFNESPLTSSEETALFASSLHMLGIGQVVFSSRLSPEGLVEFMRLLSAKPEAGKTLTDLQKAVQGVRIDGLQMIFILSFVVTGEQDEAQQKPGKLSERQVKAFAAARTLPDFLYLLLKQNEALTSKEAGAVSDLLDSALGRETSTEQFEADMPWALYDPRIRARWDELLKGVLDRRKWDRPALVTQLGLLRRADIVKLQSHASLETREALLYTLEKARAVLMNPVGERQPKFGVYAYARLLGELGRSGSLDALFGEYDFLKTLLAGGKLGEHAAALSKLVEEKAPSSALAAGLAQRAAGTECEGEAFRKLVEFAAWLGPKMAPLLLEELRSVQDKGARRSLSAMLAALCRRFGDAPLLEALKDEDYFQVVQAASILSEMNQPESVRHIAPLLHHPHAKVREAVVRALGRFKTPAALSALYSFVGSDVAAEEARLAVTTLSLTGEPGVAEKLMEIFPAAGYDVQVGILTALGRLGGARTRAFLEPLAKKSFMEWITGRNKELRDAAKASFEQASKETQHG